MLTSFKSLTTGRKAVFLIAAVLCLVAFSVGQSLIATQWVRTLMACVFQLLWLALACLLLLRVTRRWLAEVMFDRVERGHIAIATVLFAILGVAFFYYFYQTERDIKIYDSALYWKRLLADRNLIADSIPDYLISLRATLATDYNNLYIFPLILVSYVTGIDFGGFSTAILLVYYIPACFFLAVFALRVNRLASGRNPGIFSFVLCFGLCALNAGSLWPVMNGYLDVAGMLFIALLLNITLHWQMLQWDWKKSVGAGALALLLMLSRGEYEFYLAAFWIITLLSALVQLARQQKRGEALKALLLNLAVAAGTFILLALLVNPAILRLVFTRDYRALYSAYHVLTLWENLWSFAQSIGILWLVLALFGVIYLAGKKETRGLCVRLLVISGLTAVFLCSVVDMHVRHYFLFLPTLMVLVCAFAEFSIEYSRKNEKPIFVISTVLVTVLSFGLSFIQPLAVYSGMSEPLTPTLHRYPIKNPYYSVTRHIASDLSKLVGNTSQTVYVVGDGPLNNEMLENSYLPEKENATPYLLRVSNVDTRDGFPSQMLLADYVFVNRPYQSDFVSVQQVQFQIYNLLVNDPAAREYYELYETYNSTTPNIYFELYKKIKPVDKAFVDTLVERIRTYYPDNPFMYEPNYALALFQAQDDLTFDYNYWSNALYLHMRDSRPLRFVLGDTAEFDTLAFTLSCWMDNMSLTISNQEGVIEQLPVTMGEYVAYEFDIAGSEYLTVSIEEKTEGQFRNTTFELAFAKDSLR